MSHSPDATVPNGQGTALESEAADPLLHIRRLSAAHIHPDHPEALLTHEWLVGNGLGGYASSTVLGVTTRRYHGLLVAALPAPAGRVVMVSHLAECLMLPGGRTVPIGGEERLAGEVDLPGVEALQEFRLENGLPVWVYQVEDFILEKRVLLVHGQNTVHALYRLVNGHEPIELELRPSVHFRHHESAVSEALFDPYVLTIIDDRYEITGLPSLPPLRLFVHGEYPALTVEPGTIRDSYYRQEASRGYESLGPLWSPGRFHVRLSPGRDAALTASTEAWEAILALPPAEALAAEHARRRGLLLGSGLPASQSLARELVLAGDQFIITPAGRVEDAARARAAGDEVRTVIAGYHWFTDWGRDTMISLEGLTLTTGRQVEAGYILRTFSHYLRDGLIPNMFPDEEKQGLYHTADATLWYFHAVHRYVLATGDRETLRLLLPGLRDVVEKHLRGTRFGICVDPADGLLRQGEEGYQLTWMDAKVEGWVVTPRRGKAVEINALWYNALRLLEGWVREEHSDAAAAVYGEHADRAQEQFNQRFWYPEGSYLYDVVDGEEGDDPACRPNQVLAIALDHPVLRPDRWELVLETVRERLLTPYGLRSLAPGHPDYKSRYFGDLRARDAAYHQGTVWAWLIGPFIDAWLRVYPDRVEEARRFLAAFDRHLDEAGIGSVSEIFDAESPYTPRGCIAQAWSVAEALRLFCRVSRLH